MAGSSQQLVLAFEILRQPLPLAAHTGRLEAITRRLHRTAEPTDEASGSLWRWRPIRQLLTRELKSRIQELVPHPMKDSRAQQALKRIGCELLREPEPRSLDVLRTSATLSHRAFWSGEAAHTARVIALQRRAERRTREGADWWLVLFNSRPWKQMIIPASSR